MTTIIITSYKRNLFFFLTHNLNFSIKLLSLSFFVFIFIYAIIVIAYLVINLLMPYVDVYTEAVVKTN